MKIYASASNFPEWWLDMGKKSRLEYKRQNPKSKLVKMPGALRVGLNKSDKKGGSIKRTSSKPNINNKINNIKPKIKPKIKSKNPNTYSNGKFKLSTGAKLGIGTAIGSVLLGAVGAPIISEMFPNATPDFLKNIGQAIANHDATGIANKAHNFMQQGLDKAQSWLKAIEEPMSKISKHLKAASDNPNLKSTYNNISNSVKDGISNINKLTTPLVDQVEEKIQPVKDKLEETYKNVQPTINKVSGNIKDKATDVYNKIYGDKEKTLPFTTDDQQTPQIDNLTETQKVPVLNKEKLGSITNIEQPTEKSNTVELSKPKLNDSLNNINNTNNVNTINDTADTTNTKRIVPLKQPTLNTKAVEDLQTKLDNEKPIRVIPGSTDNKQTLVSDLDRLKKAAKEFNDMEDPAKVEAEKADEEYWKNRAKSPLRTRRDQYLQRYMVKHPVPVPRQNPIYEAQNRAAEQARAAEQYQNLIATDSNAFADYKRKLGLRS